MTMTFRPVVAGTTDVSVIIRIVDSADGTPEPAVAYNTSGIDIRYRRDGATDTAITEATLATLDAAHTDGGFLHIGNGYYRVDLPDAACASGVNGVLVHGTVTGMVVIGCYVPLLAVNPYDAVRMGMTSLPNAAAEAAGGLYTRGTGAGQLNQDANGRLDSNLVAWRGTQPNTLTSGRVEVLVGAVTNGVIAAASFAANALDAVWSTATRVLTAGTNIVLAKGTGVTGFNDASAADVADAVWDELQSGHVGAGSFGEIATEIADILADTADMQPKLGAPAGASMSADIAAVKAQTAAIEADTQDLQAQVGTDGAGLTNLPWNTAWDAEVQSECADAITAAALATAAELAKVPKSDSTVTWNATALASINAQVDAAIVDAAFRFGLHAEGTLSGTHSSTTADLGTAAPSGDVSNYVLYIPSRTFIKIIDSYDTGTGVATFEATAATLTNGDPWYLFATPTASAANPIPADVKRVNNTAIIGDGSSGNKFRGNP